MLGGILCPLGLFLFAGTSLKQVHWSEFSRLPFDSLSAADLPFVPHRSRPHDHEYPVRRRSHSVFPERFHVPRRVSLPPPPLLSLVLTSPSFFSSAYRPVAASAMASNSFMRSSFAAGFPLVRRLSPLLVASLSPRSDASSRFGVNSSATKCTSSSDPSAQVACWEVCSHSWLPCRSFSSATAREFGRGASTATGRKHVEESFSIFYLVFSSPTSLLRFI